MGHLRHVSGGDRREGGRSLVLMLLGPGRGRSYVLLLSGPGRGLLYWTANTFVLRAKFGPHQGPFGPQKGLIMFIGLEGRV